MLFDEIFTYVDYKSRHSLGSDSFEESRYIFYCVIKILGIPAGTNSEQTQKMFENSDLAAEIGKIEGFMILAEEMEKRNIDIYDECDAIDADLEFVYSALSENNGPINLIEILNYFYIHEITISDEYYTDELFDDIVSELPEILFTHYNICPEMLIYYPQPLPFDNPLEDLERKIASAIHADNINRQLSGEPIDNDEPQLVLSQDQLNMVLGRRRTGYSYPKSAKNTEIWENYERNGFEEWLNTRVLYKLTV